MSVENNLELPESACAYERYDPRTLQPANAETSIRLQELGWKSEDFNGRTVLDIGCNSGLLTMYALKLGAAKVHACDVQGVFVDFVSRVIAGRSLPVLVSKIGLDKLEPAAHKADIVLFMEVLHWAVSQGLELRDVIRRLAELTDDLLYIEFPWSVKEPSIQKQTKLTEEMYCPEAVLDELTRYFAEVRVVRFMRYFGYNSGSTRILIEARGKRLEASLLAQLPKVYSLDVALSRGRNQSYLLNSAAGPLFAKLLAPESPLTKIPEPLRDRMFDEVRSIQPATIVAPEKLNGRYLLAAASGRHWMIFPFLGRLPSAGKARAFPIDFDQLAELFLRVRRDLRAVSPQLIDTLRRHGLLRDVRSIANSSAPWVVEPGELAPIKNDLLQSLEVLQNGSDEMLDALCHGDLQTGNFIFDDKNVGRVVDLDAMMVGPVYSDGLLGLIWRGADEEVLASFCNRLEREERRPAAPYDVAYAIASGISWYSTVRQSKPSAVAEGQIDRLCKGLREAIGLARRFDIERKG
jgi:SAM-dependent methyltransferase